MNFERLGIEASRQEGLRQQDIELLEKKLRLQPLNTGLITLTVTGLALIFVYFGLQRLTPTLIATTQQMLVSLGISAALIVSPTLAISSRQAKKKGEAIRLDLSEFKVNIYTLPIIKKHIESDDGDHEIILGEMHIDFDVPKDIYDQLAVGDLCDAYYAKNSQILLGVKRVTDGLIVYEAK